MTYQVLSVLDLRPGEAGEVVAEELLDGFASAHPELGPAASIDVKAGTVDVLVSPEADSADTAARLVAPLIRESLQASGLGDRSFRSVHVDLTR